MFEFGFTELCLIVVVAVFVIGPKDIPGLLQTLGRTARRLQYMKFALSQQFEDFMKANDLNEIRHFSVDPMDNVNEKEADEMDVIENTLTPDKPTDLSEPVLEAQNIIPRRPSEKAE